MLFNPVGNETEGRMSKVETSQPPVKAARNSHGARRTTSTVPWRELITSSLPFVCWCYRGFVLNFPLNLYPHFSLYLRPHL